MLGDGGPGSSYNRCYDWKVPFDGRIVAVGGHLHGGAKDMWMSQPRCQDRRILDNSPHFGMPDHIYYKARPILHEPGPFDTRYFMSRTGIPVRKGEIIRLNADLRQQRPAPARDGDLARLRHARRLDPEGLRPRCPADAVAHHQAGPVPRRAARRSRCRSIASPPAGAPRRSRSTRPTPSRSSRARPWTCATTRSAPSHISLQAGGRCTWRFADAIPHNVLFASGPRLVGSPTLSDGKTYTTTFSAPGHYELFCYLHPMTMHETVEVRP